MDNVDEDGENYYIDIEDNLYGYVLGLDEAKEVDPTSSYTAHGPSMNWWRPSPTSWEPQTSIPIPKNSRTSSASTAGRPI